MRKKKQTNKQATKICSSPVFVLLYLFIHLLCIYQETTAIPIRQKKKKEMRVPELGVSEEGVSCEVSR